MGANRRAALAYRLLAEGFLPPRDELPPTVLAEVLGEAVLSTRGPVLAPRVRALRATASKATVPRLHAEHRRLFGGPGRLPAPPFESAYRGDGRVMGPAMGDLAELLSAAERRVARERPLLPDHLVVELALAADLFERGESGAAPLRTLLKLHLAEWLPAFVRRLEDRLVGIDLAEGSP